MSSIFASLTKAGRKYLQGEDVAGVTKVVDLCNDDALESINAAGTGIVELLKADTSDAVNLAEEILQPDRVVMKFNLNLNGSLADQPFFIAPFACTVKSIQEIHSVAGNDASAVTAVVKKVSDGAALTAGTALMSDTFNMKGTANTLQTGTMSSTASDLELAENDRLYVDFTGTLTTLAGVVLTVVLSPGAKANLAVFNMNANAELLDQCFFIANRPMKIRAIKYAHTTKGTDASAVNAQVVKDTGTDAPGAGTDLLTNNSNAGFNCKGDNDTVEEGALSATAANLLLAPGDRLTVDFAGTTTALAGVVIVVEFEPSPGRIDVVFNLLTNAQLTDQAFFIANRQYQIEAISEVHSVAGTDGGAVSAQVTIDNLTDAPGAGTDILSNNTNVGFDMKGTANTVQAGTFKDTRENFLLPGDRLSVDMAGTITSLAGAVVVATLKAA